MRGEGLVLTHPALTEAAEATTGWNRDAGTVVLGKWKCASEPQSKNIRELTALLEQLSPKGKLPPAVHCMLPTGVPEMIAKMHRVATAAPDKIVLALAEKQAAGGGGGAGLKKVSPVEGVEDAITSALTKFDSLHAYFERGERAEIARLLLEEVVVDLEITPGKTGKVAQKFVAAQVQKCVGSEFGRWRRLRQPPRDVTQ